MLVVSGVGLCLPIWFEPHYAAPVCSVFYALELQVMRRIYLWDFNGRQRGRAFVRFLVSACFLLLVVRVLVGALHIPIPREFARTWSGTFEENLTRAAILDSFGRGPGKHLIIARYGPNHDPNIEWVYNSADIDNEKVVWAREMDPAANDELLYYFRDRETWLLQADEIPPRLSPYVRNAHSVKMSSLRASGTKNDNGH